MVINKIQVIGKDSTLKGYYTGERCGKLQVTNSIRLAPWFGKERVEEVAEWLRCQFGNYVFVVIPINVD